MSRRRFINLRVGINTLSNDVETPALLIAQHLGLLSFERISYPGIALICIIPCIIFCRTVSDIEIPNHLRQTVGAKKKMLRRCASLLFE